MRDPVEKMSEQITSEERVEDFQEALETHNLTDLNRLFAEGMDGYLPQLRAQKSRFSANVMDIAEQHSRSEDWGPAIENARKLLAKVEAADQIN
ncbi:MAG TPA: hypothetical protein VEC13_00215 [Candidatus Paceibacterota bacterium]|nr:hypothetical protein [Candidatus Paceibacterota bacterium]